jgi:hemerythrin-like metal-binding protein
MSPVVWSTRYATGHGGIDDQHRVLFKLLDKVRAGLEAPHHGGCRQIVLDLFKYVVEHFGYEADLIEASSYPDRARHLAEHAGLIRQAQAFKAQIFADQDARLEFASFLAGWVEHHIASEDVNLAKHLAG